MVAMDMAQEACQGWKKTIDWTEEVDCIYLVSKMALQLKKTNAYRECAGTQA